jgi:hypothetical protein
MAWVQFKCRVWHGTRAGCTSAVRFQVAFPHGSFSHIIQIVLHHESTTAESASIYNPGTGILALSVINASDGTVLK